MDGLHLQCLADVLLSNGGEESRVMYHPVHILVDHNRVQVLQVQHIGIAIGTWREIYAWAGRRGEIVTYIKDQN